MNVEATLDALYVEIAAAVENPRQLESLSRIKQACDYLATHRIKITPTSIERYCLDRGWSGPKAQSIRNSSDVLAKYLHLRCGGQTVPRAPVGKADRFAIQDESVRAYVNLVEQERDQAIAAKTRIEKALRSIPGIPADDLIRAGFGKGTPSQVIPAQRYLQPEVTQGIRALLNTETLEQCGLELYKDRIRQSTTRNVLLEASSVRALRCLLDTPSSQSEKPVE